MDALAVRGMLVAMNLVHRLLAIVLSLACTVASQEARQERFVHRPRLPAELTERHVLDEVVIKFREGSAVRLRNGRFTSPMGLANTGRIMSLVGRRQLRRFFQRAEADLDRERVEILARLPRGERRPAELNLYFAVQTSGQADSEGLIDALNEDPVVEVAYADWNPAKAYVLFEDIPPTTPDWSSKQLSQGAAPNGTNAATAWRITGGRGQGLTVGHVEYGWYAEHEDIPKLKGATRLGTANNSAIYTFHGTACVGILNAEHNAYGVNGYAPESGLVLAGVVSGTANAVNLISKVLKPGDVMSSSYGVYLRCGIANVGLPPEAGNQGDFDAIKNATAKGIIYTVSAGNSKHDLDSSCWNGLFDLNKRDSGALIIGASIPTARTRYVLSNFGTRIDAHGWGSGVYTTGYGYLFKPNLDLRQYYTERFGGTSAAAAQVGGVCAAFMAAVREQNGVVPTAKQVRDILRKHGSPAPASEKIASLPDLKKMLAAVGLPDGLEITKDPERGGTLEFKVSGKPQGGFILAVSPARSRLPLGMNRPLLLDANQMVILEIGGFGTTTSVARKYPVPNNMILVGTSAYLQALDWDTRQTVHMNSSVEVFVRK